jgi:hypothetical protein
VGDGVALRDVKRIELLLGGSQRLFDGIWDLAGFG